MASCSGLQDHPVEVRGGLEMGEGGGALHGKGVDEVLPLRKRGGG